MFVKLLSVAAAGAAGLTVRNLKYDKANNKITRHGHGLVNGYLVMYELNGGTTTAGLTDNTLYIVSDVSGADFKLKTVKNAADNATLVAGQKGDATHDGKTTFTDDSGTKQTSLTLVTARKVVKTVAANDAVTVAAGNGAATTVDANTKHQVYCTGATDASQNGVTQCNLKAANATPTVRTDGMHLDYVWNETALTNAAGDSAFFPAKADGTADTTAIDTTAQAAADITSIWLLERSETHIVIPVATKKNAWDTENNKVIAQHNFADGNLVYYSAVETVAKGLKNKTVYYIRDTFNAAGTSSAVTGSKESFTLNGATNDDKTAIAEVDTLVEFTKAGKGGFFEGVTATEVTAATKSTDTDGGVITCATNCPADNDIVIFYCVDQDKCSGWAGAEHGQEYIVVDKANNTTCRLVKGRTTSSEHKKKLKFSKAVAKADDGSAYLLKIETTGTGSENKSTNKVGILAGKAGSGSAARSLAMFGTAMAMGAAFLFA